MDGDAMESAWCVMCEADRPCLRVTRPETYHVAGHPVTLDVPRLVCQTCGEANADEDIAARVLSGVRAAAGG